MTVKINRVRAAVKVHVPAKKFIKLSITVNELSC